jgi:hypothetical protein
MERQPLLILVMLFLPLLSIYGGTGRANDGHLFFLFVLAMLGIILGIMYLAGYIRYLFRKFFSHRDHKNGLHA